MKIIIDAMGGDNAPQVPVEAGIKAAKDRNFDIIFAGNKDILTHELEKYEYDPKKIEIIDCREVITNHDEPVKAVRTKKDSSIVVGARLLPRPAI